MSATTKVRTAHAEMDAVRLDWQGPAALATSGAGVLLMDGPLIAPVGGGLMGLSAVAMLASWRRRQRQHLAATLGATLAPMIGRGAASSVRGRRWSGWGLGGGRPARIEIKYDPAADSAAPDFTSQVCERVEARLGAPYRVSKHKVARCVLVLAIDPAVEAAATSPNPWLAERATDIVATFLGRDASIALQWQGESLRRLEVSHHMGVKISPNPLMRLRVEDAVNKMLPGRWRAAWDLEADSVIIEQRPEIPKDLQRDTGAIAAEWESRLPYAVDEDGHVLAWDLSSSAATPHFMTIGSTGTGKTVLIRTLITEAARRGWCLRLCDPKRIEFAGYRSWPNVQTVATAIPDIVAVIHQTWLEMERRYKLIEAGEASTEDFPRLLLVLDEYRYFYGVVNDWYAEVKGPGGSKVCPVLGEVFLIASLGRSAKVNIILGTQRPDAAWLGGDVRDQFMARASLGRLSRDGAQMLWGSPAVGVSVPRGKPGRGTSVGVDGQPVECQTYWTPDPRSSAAGDLDLLEALRPSSTTWEPYVVVPPSRVDEDGELRELKGMWPEYRDAAYVPLSERPDLAMGSGQSAGAVAAADASSALADEVEMDEYLAAHECAAASVLPGQLMCIDAEMDLWGVVESVDEDYADTDQVVVSWRADDGSDFGLLSLDGSEVVAVRDQNLDSTGVVTDDLGDIPGSGKTH